MKLKLLIGRSSIVNGLAVVFISMQVCISAGMESVIRSRMLQQSYSPTRQYTQRPQSGYTRASSQQSNPSYTRINSGYGRPASSLVAKTEETNKNEDDKKSGVFNSDSKVFKGEGGIFKDKSNDQQQSDSGAQVFKGTGGVFKSEGGIFKGSTSIFG